MTQYMLMFSLGPVQPFIMQARKTRDLWIGSMLLSKLMEAGMNDIKGMFVFPAERTVKTTPNIPNKYVAVFDTLSHARDAAQQSQTQIKECWEKVYQKVWKEIINNFADQTTIEIWNRQTSFEHLFEIYWAAAPFKGGQENNPYGTWLATTEDLFTARKRLRDFKPQNEEGEKSSISGEREILHNIRVDSKSIKGFWQNIAQSLSLYDINQQGEERLDAIDIVKRFAVRASAINSSGYFPSTSSIATASFVETLMANDPTQEAFVNWQEATKINLATKPKEAVGDIPYLHKLAPEAWKWLLSLDGDLYFHAVFAQERLKKDYDIIDAEKTIQRGKAALTRLLRTTDELKITRPTPYYAIVCMDGDKMGTLLSQTKSDVEHRKISQALSSFALGTVPDLVEKQYPARLVYAGGDDALAFAPLARDKTKTNSGQPLSILELADKLQLRYQEQVRAVLQSEDEERKDKVTASIGIAIAHHYTSLSYALRAAREAEHAAKHHYHRNALVITILRRSGEQTRIGCKWQYKGLKDDGQPIKLFSLFLQLFKDDVLSPKCVYFLLEEASALVGLEENAQKSEIARVLFRQTNSTQKATQISVIKHNLFREASSETKESKEDTAKTVMKRLAYYLVELAIKMDANDDDTQLQTEHDQKKLAIELHSTERRYGLVEVFGWLLAMAFLARKDQEVE